MKQTYSSSAQPVLVVGSVAFDQIQTPTGGSNGPILGGSATYASIATSYLAPTRLVGVVGTDFGEEFIARFRQRNIDIEGLQIDSSGKTFFWSGRYGENFSTTETLEIDLNVFEHFRPDLPAEYRNTPYILLGAIHPELQNCVLDQMTAKAFVVADTRDLWINITRDELLRLLPRVDMLVINDDEAQLLSGESNLIKAGRHLLTLGPRMVLIKKGQHGSILFHPEGLYALPAYPVTEVLDPTGAGDSFAGALIGHLAAVDRTDFKTLKEAIGYATVAGSLTVEAFGVERLDTAGLETVQARRDELQAMVSL